MKKLPIIGLLIGAVAAIFAMKKKKEDAADGRYRLREQRRVEEPSLSPGSALQATVDRLPRDVTLRTTTLDRSRGRHMRLRAIISDFDPQEDNRAQEPLLR